MYTLSKSRDGQPRVIKIKFGLSALTIFVLFHGFLPQTLTHIYMYSLQLMLQCLQDYPPPLPNQKS